MDCQCTPEQQLILYYLNLDFLLGKCLFLDYRYKV